MVQSEYNKRSDPDLDNIAKPYIDALQRRQAGLITNDPLVRDLRIVKIAVNDPILKLPEIDDAPASSELAQERICPGNGGLAGGGESDDHRGGVCTMSERLMTQREFVKELRRDYQARGFSELDPKRVAEELGRTYEPDLAFKLGDHVDVIEIKSKQQPQTAMQIGRLRKIIEARPNWHFRFVVAPKRPAALPTINAEDSVARRLTAARDLARSDRELAVIQLWMAIEICLRRILESHGEPPPSDSTVMEMARSLRRLGELDDEDLKLLEQGYRARNLAVHGFCLPPDQNPPAALFDLALDLCASAGIEVAKPPHFAEKRA